MKIIQKTKDIEKERREGKREREREREEEKKRREIESDHLTEYMFCATFYNSFKPL